MVRFTAFKTAAAISALSLIAFSGSAVPTATPAAASVNISVGLNFGGIGFGYFHSNLSRRGHWINHPIWGDVWVPPRGFRPYYNGYWTYSDYGLLWVGYDRWSDTTEHYGRWVWDRYYGTWLWIPGYVWSPGWVVWRTGGGYFGWLPMPPDYGDYDDGPYYGGRYSWNDYYGYGDWYGLNGNAFFGLWVFVDDNHFYRRDYRNYAFYDSRRVGSIINRTSDSTNYAVQGDRIVNRSISADRLERITHQRIQPVEARRVLKGNVPMATVGGGRALARQEGSGKSAPHVHDRNFQPLAGGHGRKGAMPLLQPEPDRGNMRERMRNRGGDNGAKPSTGPQPRGGNNEATPSPQPQPNADEGRGGKGRDRGGDNEATPAPQPQPNADESRGGKGRNRGGDEATPTPQPQPNADKSRGGKGRNRGGDNEATPTPQPQPQPNGDNSRGQGRGNAAEQPPAGGKDAKGKQGSQHPNADKKGDAEQPQNPDEDKRKKRDENSPQH
ncbi:MAG: DUF6600 domain-containing protein [bacterium]